MPWQLTTPINTGDLDSVASYVQVKLTGQQWRDGMIAVTWEYGNTVDSVWVPGATPKGVNPNHTILDEEYITLVTTHETKDKEKTYNANARGLYEHLANLGLIGPGSVV